MHDGLHEDGTDPRPAATGAPNLGRARAARARAPRSLPARALVGLLALLLLFTGPGGPPLVVAQANDAVLREARERFDALFGPLAEHRASLDRTTFDLTALSLDLAFEDAEGIARHVHREVRLEPYHGVLRGAEGTLASGAGNALDQALLTAVLLGDAGYETEIRRARLDDARTDLVLAQIQPPTAALASPPPSSLDLDEADLAALEEEISERMAAILRDVDAVEALLAREAPLAGDGMALVREAAADYAWVAYRLSPSAPWSEAHPVFGAAPAEFVGLAPDETLSGSVPEELQHRFRFQVFIERRLGDELLVQPVTAVWERPVANLYGVPITYANVPDGLEAVTDAADTDTLMRATGFFFPMLAGDLADGAMAFDMLGSVVPPDAAASPFAGVFQSVSRALGGATGMLGSIGNASEEPPEDAVALTAQWFEFTFVAPGGETTTHRRMVTDRLGAEARASGSLRLDPAVGEREAFAALASVHTLMLDPGRYADAYVLDRILASVLEMRGFLDRALEAAAGSGDVPRMSSRLSALEEPIAPLSLFQTFAEAPVGDGVVSYRPAPGMLVLSQDLAGAGAQVDVVANPRWTLRPGADGVRFDASAGLRAGVWETRTEGLPLERDGDPTIPAFAALLGAGAGGATLVMPGTLDALPLPRAARDAIAEDLARGYLVVAPAAGAATLTEAGWWRVDPVTGETLGRGVDGRGNVFLEYLTTFEVSLAITAGSTVYGAHQCTKIADPHVAGCCLVQNVVLAGAGVAAGVRLGLWAGANLGKALVVFGIMDVGANVGGAFLPTLCW